MALFKKSKRVIEVGGQKIELEPKPSKNPFSLFGKKSQKGAPASAQQQKPQQVAEPANKIEADFGVPVQAQTPQPQPEQAQAQAQQKPKPKMPGMPNIQTLFARPQKEKSPVEQLSINIKPLKKQKLEFPQYISSPGAEAAAEELGAQGTPVVKSKVKPNLITNYLQKTLSKQKGLANALREQNIKTEPFGFVKRMFIASVILSIVLAVTLFILFTILGLQTIECVVLAAVMAIAIFQTAFKTFLQFPLAKSKNTSKNVERDILFAARDLIISLRSGMPLFNAITSVSKGYGDASNEFAKIVDRVQLGMPLEEAIDDTIATTKSQSFRRIMLQASVSIKAGADVVGALQSIIDQLSQERIIELRSYGQKLNAIAMFYMLFGVILPSMGIAVITILTTFIAIFTVDTTVFEFVLVGIIALQIIFLKIITSSRPVFTM
ncbi:MAG: type II secretion system F family protein [Candidatus Micrarchaeales archaeon]